MTINIRHGFCSNGHIDIFYERLVGIQRRCLNPNDRRYYDYGGRGIELYEKWQNKTKESIQSFKDYLISLYPNAERMMEFEGYEVDRYPNNDGNYEPGNIRLALPPDQNRNSRANIKVVYNGVSYCAAELYRMLKPKVVRSIFETRLKRGEDPILACRSRDSKKQKGSL
jgi:hypothetical protein